MVYRPATMVIGALRRPYFPVFVCAKASFLSSRSCLFVCARAITTAGVVAQAENQAANSPEGGELGTTSGTMTDFTVANGLVGQGELTEVVANHIGSDFDG